MLDTVQFLLSVNVLSISISADFSFYYCIYFLLSYLTRIVPNNGDSPKSSRPMYQNLQGCIFEANSTRISIKLPVDIVYKVFTPTRSALDFKHASQQQRTHKYMKVHEDIYVAYILTLAVLPYNTMIYYPIASDGFTHRPNRPWPRVPRFWKPSTTPSYDDSLLT